MTLDCDRCGLPVARGDGYVHLPATDLREAEAGRLAWERERAAELFDAGLPRPLLARWRVHHERCVPLRPGDYWQPVAAVDSLSELVVTGRFLASSKLWLHLTDWDDFYRRLTRE